MQFNSTKKKGKRSKTFWENIPRIYKFMRVSYCFNVTEKKNFLTSLTRFLTAIHGSSLKDQGYLSHKKVTQLHKFPIKNETFLASQLLLSHWPAKKRRKIVYNFQLSPTIAIRKKKKHEWLHFCCVVNSWLSRTILSSPNFFHSLSKKKSIHNRIILWYGGDEWKWLSL